MNEQMLDKENDDVISNGSAYLIASFFGCGCLIVLGTISWICGITFIGIPEEFLLLSMYLIGLGAVPYILFGIAGVLWLIDKKLESMQEQDV